MTTCRLPVLLLSALSLLGCTEYVTKEEFAPKMYSEQPKSILVLPPINKTTAANAKDYYLTTVADPLTNNGYYVFPIEVVVDILQQEGLSDTETMQNLPPQKFKEFFGADAVLYVTLSEWDTKYLVTAGSVNVRAECILKSTRNGEELWFYDKEISVSTTGSSGGSAGWGGLIAQIVSTAVKTATQDYVPVAREVNQKIFETIPFGKYHKDFGKDRAAKLEKKEKSGDKKK
jgi:hypothetical protein